MSLEQLKSDLRRDVQKNGSATCPCCNQDVHLDEIRITDDMCCMLENWFAQYDQEWAYAFHFITSAPERRIFNDLIDWCLVEGSTRQYGWYRITNLAISFMDNQLPAPAWIVIYNGKIFKKSPEKLKYAEIWPSSQQSSE